MDYIIGTLQSHHWDTVNVQSISCTRKTAKKLAWKIMDVPPVPRPVYSGYFVHVLAMYLQCTSPVHHPLPPVSIVQTSTYVSSSVVPSWDGEKWTPRLVGTSS